MMRIKEIFTPLISSQNRETIPRNACMAQCTVEVTVTYMVTHDKTLLVETQGVTDRLTQFSLTLHHYFNLAGKIPAQSQTTSSRFMRTNSFKPTNS